MVRLQKAWRSNALTALAVSFLFSCSQIVILQPADIIEESAPEIKFSNISPVSGPAIDGSSVEVRLIGEVVNTQLIKFYKDSLCTSLLEAAAPAEFAAQGVVLTLPENTTTSIHALAISESGLESECTHLVDFTSGSATPEPKLWSHQAYLKAPNDTSTDEFGFATAISGNTLVVGTYLEDSSTSSIIYGNDLSSTNLSGNNNGAVYVFERSENDWEHTAYLKGPNTGLNDYFGYSVDLEGETLVVGALVEDSNTNTIIHGSDLSTTNDLANNNGAVYIFKKSGSAWINQAYLKAPNTDEFDLFGSSVSLSGDTLAVSARGEDSSTSSIIHGSDLSTTNNSGDNTGAVYIFERSGDTWSHRAYLKAPNAGDSDQFGRTIHLVGDTLAVNAFYEDSSTATVLHGGDLSTTDDASSNSGAVYLFRRNGGTWSHEAYLKAPNSEADDFFGFSISLENNKIAVGSRGEDSSTSTIIHSGDFSSTNNSASNSGATYIFSRVAGTWGLEAYLKAPNSGADDIFGYSVSLAGNILAVGAPIEDSSTSNIIHGSNLDSTNDSGLRPGAVYVFTHENNTWAHTAYLKPPNAAFGFRFGTSLAQSGDTLVVGASGERSSTRDIINGNDLSATNTAVSNTGAVYVFKLSGVPGAPSLALNPVDGSPANDSTPRLNINMHGENLASSDIIELYGQVDCGGEALDIDEATIGSTQLSGSTAVSVSVTVSASSAQPEGTRYYSAKRTTADGYSVCTSASRNPAQQWAEYEYDNTPPASVTVASPAASSVTNDATPTFTGAPGSADADHPVEITLSGGTSGSCSTTAASDGSWSCTFASSIGSGASVAVNANVVQTDPSGNDSTATVVNFTLDTVAPVAPFISSPSGGATLTSGDITVSGTAEMNSTVNVTVDGQTADCSDIANGAGAWSCTLDETLSNGAYTIRAVQTDAAGNGPSAAATSSVTVAIPADPYQWSHQAYLKAPNTSTGDWFGNDVSISGDTAIVAAFEESSTSTAIINGSDLTATNNGGGKNGAVYVFKRTGTTWSHQAYLKAPNNSNSDEFGTSVSIDGNTAIVGSHYEDSNTTSVINGADLSATNNSSSSPGAAYVFRRSGSTWNHEAYLKPPNISSLDSFGFSVDVSGDAAVVGAYREDSNTTSIINGSDLSTANSAGSDNGAAYIYRRIGTIWSHEAYLKAPNSSNSDNFGYTVSLSGDTVAIGAFWEDSTTTSIISGTDLSATNDSGDRNGAVYVFNRSGTTWTHQAYLKSTNNDDQDFFGITLSLEGDSLAVGAWQEDSNTTAVINGADLSSSNNLGVNNGAVYVFERSGSTWSQAAYLKAPNSTIGDSFGRSVGLSEGLIAVGSSSEASTTTEIINGSDLSATNDSGSANGAAYVFRKNGSNWEHVAYLKAPNSSNGDLFGTSIGIDAGTIIVGATDEDSTTSSIINGADLSSTNDSGSRNGAAYVFTLSDMPEAPGITNNLPGYSPANMNNPRFSVDASGENFVASDVLELYGQIDCGGNPLNLVAGSTATTLTGVTGTSALMQIDGGDVQPEGTRIYSVKRTNADGYSVCSSANGDPSKQFVSYTHDETPPADPVITSPADGSLTNDDQFTVSGTGLSVDGRVDVTVTGGGGAGCSTSTDLGAGAWSCTLSSALTGGASVALTVSASQVDTAGNGALVSDSHSITLDTETPSAPSISSPAAAATLTSGDITVSGTSEVNATISVTVDGQTADCSDTADGSGNWSCTLDETLADAAYTIRAIQSDEAGNGPSVASTVSITVSAPTYIPWTLQSTLTAPNTTADDRFGEAVDISGDTAIIGAPREDSSTLTVINGTDLSTSNDSGDATGAAYVFKRSGTSWTLEAYLKAPNASDLDEFGLDVAIDGDTAAVSSVKEASSTTAIIHGTDLSTTDDSAGNTGAVYVYQRSGNTWTFDAYLKASNGQADDYFGRSVSVSGNTIAVGANGEDSDITSIINGSDLSSTNNTGNGTGAVYVFEKSGANWSQTAYLKGSNTDTDLDNFGHSIVIKGDRIAVGTPYEDSSTTAIIHGSDLSSTDDAGDAAGAVYVFKRSGATWTQEAYLKATGQNIGQSVDMSENRIVTGGRGAGDYFYIYKLNSSNLWEVEDVLTASALGGVTFFGWSIAISGEWIAVGEPQDRFPASGIDYGDGSVNVDMHMNRGAVYVYDYFGGSWRQHSYVRQGATWDEFGTSVSFSGSTMLVGTELAEAAYIFELEDLPTAPGIALDTPMSSPGNDSTPRFTIDFQGDNLLATDTVELYGEIDCGGDPLDFNEANFGSNQFTGSTDSIVWFELTNAQTEGTRHYSVKRTNADGFNICSSANGIPVNQYVSYEFDTTRPGDVSISSPLNGSITNDPQFTVSGSGLESGASVSVSVTGSGSAGCSTSTDLGGGTWSCTLSSALTSSASAALTVTATQEDAAGNTSNTADSISMTLDTVGPSAPVISSPTGGATLTSSSVTVSGTGEFNATVDVTVDGETADCSTTANGAGAWSCTLDETLSNAGYTIRAVQTDAAGNGPSSASTVSVTVTSDSWSMQAYLKAPNAVGNMKFGDEVDIDGDTIAVGSYWEKSTTSAIINGSDLSSTDSIGNQNGAAWIFTRSGSTWSHEAYLKAPNNDNKGDHFARTISIEGDTFVAGAFYEDSSTTSIIHGSNLSSTNEGANNAGATYVFTRSGTTWSHQAYLKAPVSEAADQFGRSVSLSSDTLAVGADGEDSSTSAIINGSNLSTTNNLGAQVGAVHIFGRSGSTWSHSAYLKAPNPSDDDAFGEKVILEGDTLIVSADGEDSDTTSIIHGSDLSATNDAGGNTGAVYVFKRTTGTWAHEAYLKAPNAGDVALFGMEIALSGDTAVVSTRGEASTTSSIIHGTDLSSTNTLGILNGAVYVFTRSGSTWSHQAYIKSPNNDNSDRFGEGIAIQGDTLLVSAPYEDSNTTSIINSSDTSSLNNLGSDSGAIYVFERSGTTWSYSAMLRAPVNPSNDGFGYSALAIDGNTVVAGALHEDSSTTAIIHGDDLSSTNDAANFAGAVYVFIKN